MKSLLILHVTFTIVSILTNGNTIIEVIDIKKIGEIESSTSRNSTNDGIVNVNDITHICILSL